MIHQLTRPLMRGLKMRSIGAVPGTLDAPETANPTSVQVFSFGPDTFEHVATKSNDEALAVVDRVRAEYGVVWVDVVGLQDIPFISALGSTLGLHRLALEDVLNTSHRPKIEHFSSTEFIVARMPSRVQGRLDLEQVSIFLVRSADEADVVVSFQEHEGDCFEPIRDRIRHARGRVRNANGDYLAYALLDAMVDASYPVLATISDELEALDIRIEKEVGKDIGQRIHGIRRELLAMRRALWPLREAITGWLRAEVNLLDDDTLPYVRDCSDHVVQLVDYVESNRELCQALSDLHENAINHRMNDVMKVLTVMSSVFIPLGFIAGLYGMNFNTDLQGNMPETQWAYGYAYALGLMAVIAISMLTYFRGKRWI